ncbi:MAG: CcmD family protein [Flavobacteriales bacterium]|nr:CcmD family protein [Flavobacteriales bacterium]
MKSIKYITALLFIFSVSSISAQSGEIEMADVMRESGKIYVVVAVLSIVFVGLVIYAAMIDRRLSKLEKEVNEK